MSEAEKLTSALNLMRRMPPSSVENSLAGLIELVPDLTDELLNAVDQPLKVQKDAKAGREFILCDYNRDGDSYRSPWSNTYFPAQDDGFVPSAALRKMEVEANDLFDTYRKLYFEGGVSSVYFFNTDKDEKDSKSFGACFLIHKGVEGGKKELESGVWNSIHVFDVSENKKGFYEYKLTTTVMVSMQVKNAQLGDVDLSGSMTQAESKVLPMNDAQPHIANLGKLLEDMELKIRNSIEGIYIQKTREVVNGMRLVNGVQNKAWEQITASLNAAVKEHGKGRTKDSD
jgi:capping protein beta